MFESYKNRMAVRGRSTGDMLRKQSNMVVEQTWDRDPNARKVYVIRADSGLPKVTEENELIDCKFSVKTYANITSDEPAYWMQFRHGEEKGIQTLVSEVMYIWKMKMVNGLGGY